MISKLTGLIDSTYDHSVVIDVNGVGYSILCSQKTLSKLGKIGETATLFTEMIVREDFMQLYGFKTGEEREWFRLFLSVQGVGMKVALAILSIAEPAQFAQAIVHQDKNFFAQAEGVGPKLAMRLVHELKDKVNKQMPIGTLDINQGFSLPTVAAQDALSALTNLGYKLGEAQEALNFAQQKAGKDATIEDLIRLSLTKLARI
ncbi:MAG: Holliday junction branch migration protein RuvA [Candidatus Paracaedimonas acanthamoebae]|uniref:Holliday junction branch migration complex subunit RuvA n=1 Tax=Candidatus Paracaedimonas acanthamoebae TaxID=244581 RepID=A0A8J7PZY5_9PROT|nr:Holliday junction branch migration protein RuvA [Candidatus Paracaedimonas acanthamoebae]